MPIISEKPDLDSGLGSPELTEGPILSTKKIEENPMSSTESKDIKSNLSKKTNESNMKIEKLNTDNTVSTLLKQDSEEDDDEEEEDETLSERIWGLTEMFPESLRTVSSSIVHHSLSLVKGTYQLSRQVVWIGVSTSILLFAPVMFEVERFNVEEMVKQDRNRLVLGPGSAMSGAPGLPPPPTR